MTISKSVSILTPILLLLGLLTQAACSSRSGEAGDRSRPVSASAADPIAVSSAPAVSRQVPLYTDATGSFVAEETSNVAPLAAGRVVETPVDVGAPVAKGQIIARLDSSDAQLRLDQAKAAVAQAEASLRQAEARIGFNGGSFKAEDVPDVQSARASYESALADEKMAEAEARRYENLVKTGDVSKSTYEKQATLAETGKARAHAAQKQYESALNAAQQGYRGIELAQASLSAGHAQLALAQKALDDTLIRAPISGYVTDRPINVGEYVGTNSKIATLVQANPIKLQLQVPGSAAAAVGLGMRVTVHVEGYLDRNFEGKITTLNPAFDPNSRSMIAEARFDNPKMELRPGMFATARILLPAGEQAVFVPKGAILVDPSMDSAEAFVLQSGKARVRVVRIGQAEGDTVRILSGVSAGETVATSGLQQLYDGASVRSR